METLNTTTENNRLIAEFLGYKLQTDPTERFFGWYKSPLGTWTKEIDLPFRTDWNWLMEVVEKIESLGYTFLTLQSPSFLTYIEENIFIENIKPKSISNNKKHGIYNACLEFIKWYNQQK